jgi:hypothetical protein
MQKRMRALLQSRYIFARDQRDNRTIKTTRKNNKNRPFDIFPEPRCFFGGAVRNPRGDLLFALRFSLVCAGAGLRPGRL